MSTLPVEVDCHLKPLSRLADPLTEKHLSRFNPERVNLETLFQWRCFRRIIETGTVPGSTQMEIIGEDRETTELTGRPKNALVECGLQILRQ